METFSQLVIELMQSHGLDRHKAIAAAARQRPDLHREFLIETNSHSAGRLIDDKFDDR